MLFFSLPLLLTSAHFILYLCTQSFAVCFCAANRQIFAFFFLILLFNIFCLVRVFRHLTLQPHLLVPITPKHRTKRTPLSSLFFKLTFFNKRDEKT